LARRHRAGIERFYDCSDEMHVCLAQMYLVDERFIRYYDAVEPGLAQFVHDIVVAAYSHP
jgi:MerR family transcriptional regulator, thiopeptide resistance regulator